MKLEIAFSKINRASVIFLESSDGLDQTGKSGHFIQVWLSTTYILRQLRNLGDHPSAEGLSDFLEVWPPPSLENDRLPSNNSPVMTAEKSPMLFAALNLGLDSDTAKQKYGYKLWLEETNKLTKGFEATLEMGKNSPLFYLQPTGFGISGVLGLKISEYATNSVPILLSWLSIQIRDDQTYTESLSQISNRCSQAAKRKEIGMTNQEELGFEFAQASGIT